MADAWGGSWGTSWGTSWGAGISAGVLAKKLRRRYRATLEDGTIIWADSHQEALRLKKQYERTLPEPDRAAVAAVKVVPKKVAYEPPDPVFYAQPIPDVFKRIDLKGDPNALLAKLAMELDDDDEEAIQIVLSML